MEKKIFNIWIIMSSICVVQDEIELKFVLGKKIFFTFSKTRRPLAVSLLIGLISLKSPLISLEFDVKFTTIDAGPLVACGLSVAPS